MALEFDVRKYREVPELDYLGEVEGPCRINNTDKEGAAKAILSQYTAEAFPSATHIFNFYLEKIDSKRGNDFYVLGDAYGPAKEVEEEATRRIHHYRALGI